jgi:hypothetical protein
MTSKNPHVSVLEGLHTLFSKFHPDWSLSANLMFFGSNELTPFGLGAYPKNGNLKEDLVYERVPACFHLFLSNLALQVYMPDLGPSPERGLDV